MTPIDLWISSGLALVRKAQRERSARRQLGQFLTPQDVATAIVPVLDARTSPLVLEPSFGAGAFLVPIIEQLMAGMTGSAGSKLGRIVTTTLWGVELDPAMYERGLAAITSRWGPLPAEHNLVLRDYFRFEPPCGGFDLIVGNPPFGGTFDADIEDCLDQRFGRYQGDKVKKETYAFFLAKALGELRPGGAIKFICSDTFLTIKTMKGLRKRLMDCGRCEVDRLPLFSEETKQPMVVLTVTASGPTASARIAGTELRRALMDSTPNFSWAMSDELAMYFDGPTLGEYVVGTGGMTIGRNELFVRKIEADGLVSETRRFEFFDEPVTVQRETERARLARLSAKLLERARVAQARGETRRNVRAVLREPSLRVALPHPDYVPYNKASGERLYADPSHVVYWKDDGDAVLTFKRNGPWYLHGVGGKPFFFREGITWQLVAPRINARYLPTGYVLDSGAPCAFLREGVAHDELWFILGWLQTKLATRILKQVINHTRNIQGKDIERLPYPHWVASVAKRRVVELTEAAVGDLVRGSDVDRARLQDELDSLFVPCAAECAHDELAA